MCEQSLKVTVFPTVNDIHSPCGVVGNIYRVSWKIALIS